MIKNRLWKKKIFSPPPPASPVRKKKLTRMQVRLFGRWGARKKKERKISPPIIEHQTGTAVWKKSTWLGGRAPRWTVQKAMEWVNEGQCLVEGEEYFTFLFARCTKTTVEIRDERWLWEPRRSRWRFSFPPRNKNACLVQNGKEKKVKIGGLVALRELHRELGFLGQRQSLVKPRFMFRLRWRVSDHTPSLLTPPARR